MANKQVTFLDLDRTAADAAAPLVGKDQLTILEAKLASWQESGQDARDFAQWSQFFDSHLQNDGMLSQRLAPSTLADNAAAAAAAAAAQAAALAAATKPAAVPAPTPAAPTPAAAAAPVNKAAPIVRALAFLALLGSLFFAAPAKSQIIYNMTSFSNSISAPIQSGFATVTNGVYFPLTSHSLLVTNVLTNEPIWVGYQGLVAGGTNPVTVSALATNFTAAWCVANFGFTTNNFCWLFTFPPVQPLVPVIMWGAISNGPSTGACPFTNGAAFN